jgi:hypothetical protein
MQIINFVNTEAVTKAIAVTAVVTGAALYAVSGQVYKSISKIASGVFSQPKVENTQDIKYLIVSPENLLGRNKEADFQTSLTVAVLASVATIAAMSSLYKARSHIYEIITRVILAGLEKLKRTQGVDPVKEIEYRVINPGGAPNEHRVALFCGGFFDHIQQEDKTAALFAKETNTSVYVFNYRGVMGSSGVYLGLAHAKKTFQVMMKHVEKSHPGKEILCIGNSIGGTVLEGIEGLELNQTTKVTYMLDRSPSSICDFANQKIPHLGEVLKYIGLNLDSFKVIKDKGIVPIVIQSADVVEAKVISGKEEILESDGFLHRESTFASRAFKEGLNCFIIGDSAKHFDPLTGFKLFPKLFA